MNLRTLMLAAAVLSAALAGCDKTPSTPPAPKMETPAASVPGTVGGPGATEGGMKGDPARGTPGGAATSSTPEGMPPGAGISKTDKGGLASRPNANDSSSQQK